MKNRIISILLISSVLLGSLAGCTDSRQSSSVEQVDYDPVEAVSKYELPEIPEEDKDFEIEMGYNNCDHMVGAIIGDLAGIYEALDLNVNVTQTNNTNISQAMSTDQMHVAYMTSSAYRAHNEGAPVVMTAANHLGGSYYLVASNDIQDPKDLVGKKLAISQNSENSPRWIKWTEELGIPTEVSNYEVIEMGQADSPSALASGQIDGYTCCDPFASQAEIMDIGHIIGIDWGTDERDENGHPVWNLCCILGMNENFKKDHPELAERLIIAHALSQQYIYQHPYNAAMMFAEGFGTSPEVGLLTVYMKTIAEGRTLQWTYRDGAIEEETKRQEEYGIDEEYITRIKDIDGYIQTDLLEASEVEDFDEFAENIKLDETFPIGMPFEEWLAKSKAIDGIESDMGDDIKTPDIYVREGYTTR